MADDDKAEPRAESTFVIVARDYADIVHLENPGVIERILSGSRTEKLAYVSALLALKAFSVPARISLLWPKSWLS
jgi:hypothetical protein